MAAPIRFRANQEVSKEDLTNFASAVPLWQMGIVEVTGHNLEARGREEVNRLLEAGWCLLHIYTLKYHEDDVWRERPMAILGKSRDKKAEKSLDSGEISFR
jgi:hypothetical protein